MKNKLFLFLIMGALVFGITGCKNGVENHNQNNNQNANTNINENSGDNREVLELEDYRNNPISMNYEDDKLLNIKKININNVALNERESSEYNNEKELDIFIKYIKDNLNVEINDKWKVMIHHYNSEKTDGMVEFQYSIGEIMTNRTILFGLENGKFNTLYYKCLNEKIDEDSLINRVKLFNDKYIQGKRKLEKGETFYEEQVDYVYYINVDKLVYNYAFFTKYDMGIINNDWGTVRLIDENGNAIPIK